MKNIRKWVSENVAHTTFRDVECTTHGRYCPGCQAEAAIAADEKAQRPFILAGKRYRAMEQYSLKTRIDYNGK